MVNLGQAWVDIYSSANKEVEFSISGGGSGTGISALINKTTNICQSSREMKDKEITDAKKAGIQPIETIVAQDGLSVIVNPSNKISKLTIDQLSEIFTGKITNWKELGGNDTKIVVLSRDKSSGTHDFFLEQVLRKGNAKGPEEYAPSVLLLQSSTTISNEVSTNEASIGYVGMGYVKAGKEKTIAVAKDASSPYIEPTIENVLNKTYPIARPLYFYTDGNPKGDVQKFINFVLSDAGQSVVEKLDFVPLKKD